MKSEILIKVNSFVKKRLIELSGILLVFIGVFLLVSVASYSPSDPNFIYTPENVKINNLIRQQRLLNVKFKTLH